MEKKKYKKNPPSIHFAIYGHGDPFTGELRYIGKSVQGLYRAKAHFRPSAIKTRENPHHAAWIKSCIERGQKPDAFILEEFDSEAPLNDAERFWIANIRATGAELLNVLDGGDTPPRTVNTPEMIEALIARNHAREYPRGHHHTEEHKEAIRIGMLGKNRRPKSDEEKTAMAIKKGGRAFTDQHGNLYYNISAFARSIGVARQDVQRVLKAASKRKSVKGHKLRYAD